MDNATVEAAAYVLQRSSVQRDNESSPFLRFLVHVEKQPVLANTIAELREGRSSDQLVFLACYKQFALLTGAPFVYWANAKTLGKLIKYPSFEPCAAEVRKGLRTGDNFRFVRTLWEIPQHEFTPAISADDELEQRESSLWVPLVLSGSSQPWFSPLLVALNWKRNGRELRQYVTKYGSPSRLIQAEDFYFRAGMSWTLRTTRFIPYAIPAGCIPTGSRPMAFPKPQKEFSALAISSSRVASAFMRFYGDWFTRPKFLEGKLKLLPWPVLSELLEKRLNDFVLKESQDRRCSYQGHEPFFEFVKPFSGDTGRNSVSVTIDWSSLLGKELEVEIETAYGLDNIEASELYRELDEALAVRGAAISSITDEEEDGDEDPELVLDTSENARTEIVLSHALGCAFGRWDVRYAMAEEAQPELPEPFAPLPVCPPGQLQNAEGLPALPEDVPSAYPVLIPWDGILVDDPNHPLDLERRVREVIEIIWNGDGGGAKAEAIEQEACEILGIKTLRDYFRKPAAFFADHLKRYSKSRRQAPIYWQLSAGNGNYSAWLYYHRFTQDTLYRLLGDFVEIRIQEAEREQFEFESQGGLSGDAAGLLHEVQALLQDLRLFKSELELVAPLWNPNLNDGVIINHAILWRITPYTPWQKKCKECWDKLVKGDYDWAHLAFHLWPERVIRKCTTDRSLAIAHGLEERLWQESNKGNWLPRQVSEAELQALLAEYSKPAVQNALERFLAAPPPVAAARTRNPRASKASSTSTTRRPRGNAHEVDAETSRQTLLVLTAAPAEGLGRNAIAELLAVDAASLTAVIKQLKEGGQIEQLGAARGAKYRLTESGLAAVESQAGEDD